MTACMSTRTGKFQVKQVVGLIETVTPEKLAEGTLPQLSLDAQ